MESCRFRTDDKKIAATVEGVRKLRAAYAAKSTRGTRMKIEREGRMEVDVICYRPAAGSEGKLPVLFNMHGGAWMAGDAVLMESFCQLMADELPAMVVNVNYHKADIISIPEMVEEVADCVKYFYRHGEDYRIDTGRMILGGHSAGANLAAGAALKLKEDGISLCAQMLVYPSTDLSLQGDAVEDEIASLIRLICPDGENLNHHVSQILATDEELQGLCTTLFVICGHDILKSQSLAYAKRLLDNAVPVKVKEYPEAQHGFLEVCRPDYDVEDERNTQEQDRYARDCEQWLIRELRACL